MYLSIYQQNLVSAGTTFGDDRKLKILSLLSTFNIFVSVSKLLERMCLIV